MGIFFLTVSSDEEDQRTEEKIPRFKDADELKTFSRITGLVEERVTQPEIARRLVIDDQYPKRFEPGQDESNPQEDKERMEITGETREQALARSERERTTRITSLQSQANEMLNRFRQIERTNLVFLLLGNVRRLIQNAEETLQATMKLHGQISSLELSAVPVEFGLLVERLKIRHLLPITNIVMMAGMWCTAAGCVLILPGFLRFEFIEMLGLGWFYYIPLWLQAMPGAMLIARGAYVVWIGFKARRNLEGSWLVPT